MFITSERYACVEGRVGVIQTGLWNIPQRISMCGPDQMTERHLTSHNAPSRRVLCIYSEILRNRSVLGGAWEYARGGGEGVHPLERIAEKGI